jgi:biotin transport system substrate-specific component
MSRTMSQTLVVPRLSSRTQDVLLVVSATLFLALCARITLPLPFTPVPLSLQNFGVLLVAMALGAKRGFAALGLYLMEGAAGLPVFTPGVGGLAQLLGPTGGFLMAYPAVALLTGWLAERARGKFNGFVVAGVAGEVLLFAAGVSWLFFVTGSLPAAAAFGLYPFFFAEVMKVAVAASVAPRLQRIRHS